MPIKLLDNWETVKNFVLNYGILISIATLFLFLLVYYIWAIYKEGFLKPDAKKKADKIKALTNKKIKLDTVHVFLPLTGGAKGDGLIQAAGFLKASQDFTDLNILLYDTKYDADRAKGILETLIEKWEIGDPPLAIVVTMSKTSETLAETAKEIIQKGIAEEKTWFQNPFAKKKFTELEKSFSMILTVAFSPKVPHYPSSHIYKFSINGNDEASYMKAKILNSAANNDFNLNQPLILCSTTSDYPSSAIGELTRKILKHPQTKPFIVLPFDETGKLKECKKLDLSSYDQAIVFAYDKYIFNIFEYLIAHKFKGKVLCPTTFSVEDWQQIWKGIESNKKLPQLTYYYLDIENINHVSLDPCNQFQTLAHEISLKLANQDKNFFQIYTQQFSTQEKQFYDLIDRNYISDLCYQSIIFFSIQSKQKISYFNFDKLKSKIVSHSKTPMTNLSHTDKGIGIGNSFIHKELRR